YKIIQEINLSIVELDAYVFKKIFIKFSITKFSFLLKPLFNKQNLDKSFFTNLIDELQDERDCIHLYYEMNKHKFELNKILFNVFIKKVSDVDFCLKVFSKMTNKGFLPDKFTYSSIFQKKIDAITFFKLLEQCSNDKIVIDTKFTSILSESVNKSFEIKNFYVENSKDLYNKLSYSWFHLLSKIVEHVQQEYLSCIITKIITNRIFVKIEKDSRLASIHIRELKNQKFSKISDYEYDGQKIYVGQKVKAKIINMDEYGRINLSIKQL
ncbi:S1 RNA-binding domain-containing protein, partial [Cellulophaga sp. BC115SP]|uniref:S1 RNA-binding domain-containing protein n=1 Tax=Cellulophaga sp. BC115SP TaxID=2683263 RepID=UPI001412C441